MPNREQRRLQHRLSLPQESMPKVQELQFQQLQQGQAILRVLTAQAQLLEVLCRIAMGQDNIDIDYATGLSFPVLDAEQRAEVDAKRAEAESRAAEDRRLMEEAAEDAAAEAAEATDGPA